MSSYCSFEYLALFIPVVAVIYSLFPRKYRWMVLLGASYGLFWIISKKLLVFILFSTLSIYLLGLKLSKIQEIRNQKIKEVERNQRKEIKNIANKEQIKVLLIGVILNIGLLLYFKYTPFFMKNIKELFQLLHLSFQIEIPKIIAPIGISFYSLQAVSYLMDVYHEKIQADHHLGRLALYMCFFPLIMEGPICRYSDTASKLYRGESISYHNMTFGMQRILYGLMKKIVVADRLNVFIKNVFTNYIQYDGGIIALGAIFYTCQLYMEFSGTMDVIIGSAEIFSIQLPENFRQPFFSKTISEFWQRWHITLGTWFKDYIFYPVSMSKPMKRLTISARKKMGNHYGPLIAGSIALFCVWLCNGLWHGAGWHYIFFGLYHFFFILCGNLVEPQIRKIREYLYLNPHHMIYQSLQILKTSVLVVIGELFFRAHGLKAGIAMFQMITTDFTFQSLHNGMILNLGMDEKDFMIIGIALMMVFIISLMKEKGIRIRELISKQNIVLRWGVYYAMIFFILVFGAYGPGYVPIDPIYANF